MDLGPFQPLIDALQGRRVAYLFNDRWGNWGDHWIGMGARALFDAAGIRYLAFAESRWSSSAADTAKRQCDVIALFGSGSIGRCCRQVAKARRDAAQSTGLPAILLPSSAIDSLEDLSYCEAVFLRERVSWEMLRHAHPRAILTPDLAMLAPMPDPVAAGRAYGRFLRDDHRLPGQSPHDGDPTRAPTFDRYIRLAAECEAVETNRLHFAIAAYRCGRRVIMRPCGWHKVKSYWATWWKDDPRVQWRD